MLNLAAAILISGCAAACHAEPARLNQQISVTIRGGGRDIAASFDYTCRYVSDQGGIPLYEPVPGGVLYVAPDNEALLMTSAQPHEPSLCGSDVRDGVAADQQLVPLLVWIDDVRSPSRVDEIGMSTVSAHRKFNFPELVGFSHSTTAQSVPALATAGRIVPLRDQGRAFLAGKPGSDARLISAARRVAKVEFANDDERQSFRRLLGPEIASGVRSLDLCRLAATEDGHNYLTREAPWLVRSCPSRADATFPPQRIRFSMPLSMKFEGGGRWLGGGTDGVASFLRDEESPIEPADATTGDMVRAARFWRDNVRTVTWITLGERRVQLPARSTSAYYLEEDANIILFIEDSEVMYLNNPLNWNRL